MENSMTNNEVNKEAQPSLGVDEMQFVKQMVEEKKKKEQRKALLDSYKNHPEVGDVFNELYNNGGLKAEIDNDPTILESETALKMAMKMSQMSYKQKVEAEKAKEVVEEKSESISVPAANASSGANVDPSVRTIKSLRDLDPRQLQNASIGGKVAASILSGKSIN